MKKMYERYEEAQAKLRIIFDFGICANSGSLIVKQSRQIRIF